MRLTIEWLRTLVLAAGVLLVLALGVFLAVAKYKHKFNVRELPKRLGINIQQEANGVTYSHALGSHSQFKIHASKVVQLKNDHALLHDVKIELFGEDGSRLDRIEGDEFEWDQKSDTATATGPVEITMMRPGVAPAIAPKAAANKVVHDKAIAKPLASVAETAAEGEIHIKTSGVTFDYKNGVTTTNSRVDFQLSQGEGSSMGATYDSQNGLLVLDHAVELTTARAGNTVQVHAQHAEFDRDGLLCKLHAAKADYRQGQASAAEAKILFREDGSAVRLDASNGFTIDTPTGGHIAAPTGSLDFDQHNQPRHGHLEGGVQMNSSNGTRQVHGSAPTATLDFNSQGQLRRAHLERGVEMRSEDQTMTAATLKAASEQLRVSRTWRAPVTDVEFRNAKQRGQVEPATIHGMGGVVITGESQRGKAAPVPSKLAADDLSGDFGPNSALTEMTGTGHASIDETTATGSLQTASGERIQAHFTADAPKSEAQKIGLGGAAQIEQAVLDGHVVLTQTPAPKPGAHEQAEMKATAGKAVYEGTGEWLHLTANPRVEDGAIEMTADKIDVSQQSGDALAQGNVKATWLDAGSADNNANRKSASAKDTMALGGQGPAHAIAQQAELHRANNEAVFTGHARMWQQANSIQGPVIVLDRSRKSLVSRSSDATEPVRVVLLSNGALGMTPNAASSAGTGAKPATPSTPSVIRVHGGELDYSDVERKAVMLSGSLGPVVAETGTATSTSNRVDLFLVPAGTHAPKEASQGQVDHMTASGNVVLSSEGRRGTGEQLTYTGSNGQYVLTGTPATPPRMTDAARGNVTGEALIFNSRDDSVTVEGGGHETRTETTVRQGEGRSETQK